MSGGGKKGGAGTSVSDDAPTQVRQPETPKTMAPLADGTVIGGDYRILKVIKSEPASIAYKAEDVNLSIPVLIKEFAPAGLVARDERGAQTAPLVDRVEDYNEARARFLREAQTLVRFRHPSIVRAHRVLEDKATTFMVLDFEDGEPLDAWLTDLGQPPKQSEIDRLAAPLLSALASVHGAGFLHGNICPGTILVRYGAPPVLVDFTGACELATPDTHVLGTNADKAFAAPELQSGDTARCGPWTDLYGLAGVLYLAVTGKQPSDKDRESAVAAAPAGYRAEFLEAIDRGLTPDTAQRPQSVADWAGIHPPEDPEPAFSQTAAGSTVVRQIDPDKTVLSPIGAGQSRTVLANIATRVIAALPEAKEETDIPKYDFERWLLPGAVACALLGGLLFSTGMNFALAAVFQVAATGLFFARGYMPLSRFLSHTTRQPDAIVRRAEQATRNAAWMMAAILAVMTINPLFVERFVTTTTAVPIAVLSPMIAIPALVMGACGYLGMPVRWSFSSFLAGAGNVFAVIFNVLLFAAFAYTLLNTSPNAVIPPALQVNRYLYIIATVAAGVLGILNFVSRGAARQRLKQAAVSR